MNYLCTRKRYTYAANIANIFQSCKSLQRFLNCWYKEVEKHLCIAEMPQLHKGLNRQLIIMKGFFDI